MNTEPTPSSATPETESAAAPSSSGLPQAAPQAAWPERVETGEHQVSYRATVAAPAHELWAMLADPHRHHEADGSGTVRPKVSGRTGWPWATGSAWPCGSTGCRTR